MIGLILFEVIVPSQFCLKIMDHLMLCSLGIYYFVSHSPLLTMNTYGVLQCCAYISLNVYRSNINTFQRMDIKIEMDVF